MQSYEAAPAAHGLKKSLLSLQIKLCFYKILQYCSFEEHKTEIAPLENFLQKSIFLGKKCTHLVL